MGLHGGRLIMRSFSNTNSLYETNTHSRLELLLYRLTRSPINRSPLCFSMHNKQAEKAKQDEKEMKKLQDNVQSLQLRLAAREQICRNLQEKVPSIRSSHMTQTKYCTDNVLGVEITYSEFA